MEPTRTANARFPGSTVTVSRAEQAQLRFYIQANLVTVIGAAIGLVAIRYTLVRSDWMLVDAAAVSAVVIALLVGAPVARCRPH